MTKKDNPNMGRPPKDPTDYEPNKATRKKRATAREKFEPYVDAAVETIVAGMTGGADPNELRAAREVLDRVFGRPAQEHVFIGDSDKPPIRVDSGVYKNTKKEDLHAAARLLLQARNSRKANGEQIH